MAKMYRMELQVPSTLVAPIFELLEKDEGCAVTISPIEQVVAKNKKHQHYVDGKRYKGISARDLIMESLANGPKTIQQLVNAAKTKGFSENTVSPRLSLLVKEKAVIKNSSDQYQLTK
jgi:hypothetical protein